MCASTGMSSGSVRGWSRIGSWSLPYTPPYTAWTRPSRLPPAGCWKKVVEKNRSPSGAKATSTGLSIPPVMTGSRPVPSDRERNTWAAVELHAVPSGRRCVCFANAPLVQYTQPSGPGYGPWRSFAHPVSVLPSNQVSRCPAVPVSSAAVYLRMHGGSAT